MEISTIYKQILHQKFTWCKITVGKDQKLLITYSKNTDPRTPQSVVEEMKQYFNDCPGTYNLFFKRRSTDSSTSITAYRNISVNDFGSSEEKSNPLYQSYKGNDIKKLQQQWEREFLMKMELQKKKNDLAIEYSKAKKHTSELDTLAGKALYLFSKIVTGMDVPQGILKGTTTNLSVMNSDPLKKPIQQYTKEEIEKSNLALQYFLTATNPEFLLEMAKKVQEDPGIINKLKMFM